MENANNNQPLSPLEPGTLLKDGKYEILELTSNKGGFGWIYRAKNLRGPEPKHIVAIKEYHILKLDYPERSMHTWTMLDMKECDDDMRNKFKNEASYLTKLYHELEDRHIPQVLDTVWMEDGRMFYAMTFIEGQTLREAMEGTMPEYRAVGYTIQIAKVLHKAHELGLIHADVSPNNIMQKRTLRNRNLAVLVDWGNANAMNYDDGYGIGTEGYRAPETFRGTPQADVYSLAATLLFLLTDKKPEVLDSDERVAKARHLLAKHNVSDETTAAILHAMNVDVEKATKSIHEFMMELPKDIVIKILLNYTDHDK